MAEKQDSRLLTDGETKAIIGDKYLDVFVYLHGLELFLNAQLAKVDADWIAKIKGKREEIAKLIERVDRGLCPKAGMLSSSNCNSCSKCFSQLIIALLVGAENE